MLCDDTAAQSAAAASAEASKLWMCKCEQHLQATGTGLFGRISSNAIYSAFQRVLAQRHTDPGLADSVRAVQQELQRHAGAKGLQQELTALGAYLHGARPPTLYSLTSAIAQIVPPPVHPTAETAGGDPVVQRLVQIIRSGESAATQTPQLRDLRPMLQPHHHNVVSDLVQILSRTVYCRKQHEVLLFLLRQLKPPTKGTPEFITKQQKSKYIFQCALWAPPPQPQQAKQSVAGKRPAGGTGQEGAPWGAPAQRQRTAPSSKAASPAAAAAASAASHPVGGSTAPLPEAARGHRVTPITAAAPGPPPPPGLPPPRPHQSGHLGPPPRPPHPPCPLDAAAATLHPATAIMCAVKRQKPSPPALPPPEEMSPADVDKKLGGGAFAAGWRGKLYGKLRRPNYIHPTGRHNNAKDAKEARLRLEETGS